MSHLTSVHGQGDTQQSLLASSQSAANKIAPLNGSDRVGKAGRQRSVAGPFERSRQLAWAFPN